MTILSSIIKKLYGLRPPELPLRLPLLLLLPELLPEDGGALLPLGDEDGGGE